MAHYITAVEVGSPSADERITRLQWLNTQSGVAGRSGTADMVTFIDKGNEVLVGGENGPVEVTVVRPSGRSSYLRTERNGTRTDNLLDLPRF